MTRIPRLSKYGALCMLVFLSLIPLSNQTMSPPAVAAGTQIYWGAYIKGNTYGYEDAPWDTRTMEAFEYHAGKKVSILHWGQPWFWSGEGGYQVFQRSMAEKVRQRGSIPMISWTSDDLAAGNSLNQQNFQLGDIIDGQHDAYIRQWARDAKAWGYPMMVRLNHEMNGDWFHWSESRNGNKPGQYVQMWRHVVDIFKQEGANNVTWVWSPNRYWSDSLSIPSLYPGDSYVDWVGMSGYNWGTNPAKPNNTWMTFDQVFGQTYDLLSALAPSKPLIITETAATEIGGSKASWITDILTTALPIKYPRIKALLWFNWNHPEQNGNIDWVIESSASAKAAFANGIASDYYATNVYGRLPAGTKVQPIPTTQPVTSKLEQASFDVTGGTPWYQPWIVRNSFNATFSQDNTTSVAGGKSLKVSLPKAAASEPWAVQIRQTKQSVTQGKTYVLTFYAKASTNRTLSMVLQDADAPYTEYFKQTPNLSTNWTKYSYTYHAGVSDVNMSLSFNFAQSSGQVWIDNVSLVQK